MEVDAYYTILHDFDDYMRRRRGREAARCMDVIDLSSGRPRPDNDIDPGGDINNKINTDTGSADATAVFAGSGAHYGLSYNFTFDSDDPDHDDANNYGVGDRRRLHFHHIYHNKDSNDYSQLASSSVTRRFYRHCKPLVAFVEVGG